MINNVLTTVSLVLAFALWYAGMKVGAQTDERPLTNGDVIRMVQGKIDESIILTKIRTTNNSFVTSTDGLLQLKNAKVKKNIVEAMMVASRTRGFPSTPRNSSALSSESPVEKSIANIIHDTTVQTRTSKGLTFNLKRCNKDESVIVLLFYYF
jgi:hypothetical protein